ncbi:MAG TPA: GxxExxY protein [Tepidisphaeraceae bacterium]|jgi:GxxExxY protein
MHTDRDWLNQVTEKIIGCAFKVGNKLGCGFLEKCYRNAMALELRKLGLEVKPEHPISVLYDGVVIGEYFADLLVENTVVVELKAGKGLDDVHQAQCINYLAATGKPICLLIHFGKRVQIKRIVRPGFDLESQ